MNSVKHINGRLYFEYAGLLYPVRFMWRLGETAGYEILGEPIEHG